jgi:hypothetical protein
MQSRAQEYRANAQLCALQAMAVPDRMKQFYQALQLQWECLANQAERPTATSQEASDKKAA